MDNNNNASSDPNSSIEEREEELSEFEKKVLAQEKEIREGNHSGKTKFQGAVEHRAEKGASEEEKTPIARNSRWAITAAVMVFFVLVGFTSLIVGQTDQVLSIGVIAVAVLALAFIPFANWLSAKVFDDNKADTETVGNIKGDS